MSATSARNRTHDYDPELVLAIYAEAVRTKSTPAKAVMDRFGCHHRTAQKWLAKAKSDFKAPTVIHGERAAVDAGCPCAPCFAVRKADVLRRVGHIPGQAFTRATMLALDAIGRPDGMPARRGKFGNSHMLGDLT